MRDVQIFTAGQVKVRFEVIPFKTGEILFKVHLTREFRSSFPPPPPPFQSTEMLKRAILLIKRLQRWFLRRDWRT